MGKGGSGFEKGRRLQCRKMRRRMAAPRSTAPVGPWSRVSEMQAKLHRWAAADPGRRFDDLFNFVHDPATLIVAYDRVAGNRGANTPGVDGLTVAAVEERIGVQGFLDDLRAQLKAGTFRPLPVRERKIPKPGGSGKVRKPRYSDGGGIVPHRPVIFRVSLSSPIRSMRCAVSGWRFCMPSAAGRHGVRLRGRRQRADHAAGGVDRPG